MERTNTEQCISSYSAISSNCELVKQKANAKQQKNMSRATCAQILTPPLRPVNQASSYIGVSIGCWSKSFVEILVGLQSVADAKSTPLQQTIRSNETDIPLILA